jgi:glycosyltransferase involved in cell wall biosynthesis
MATISVIIPTKERKRYVLDLLSDLSKQTQQVNQVIVSDQSEVFLPYESSYQFDLVHFQHLGNGPCSSRNTAASKSESEILVFLDDDARIAEDFIEEITKPIIKEKYKVASGTIKHLNKKGPTIKKQNQFWFFQMTKAPEKDSVKNRGYTPAGCTAITKGLFDEIGGFNEFFDPNGAAEDREFAVKIVKKNIEIGHSPKAILYHIGAESGGRTDVEQSALEFKKNVGYIIYKYYGKQKFWEYRRYLLKERLHKIVKCKMPFHNFQMVLQEFKNTNPKKYR